MLCLQYNVAQSELDIYISNQRKELAKLEETQRNLERSRATVKDRKKSVFISTFSKCSSQFYCLIYLLAMFSLLLIDLLFISAIKDLDKRLPDTQKTLTEARKKMEEASATELKATEEVRSVLCGSLI